MSRQTVTLVANDGSEIDFEIISELSYKGHDYAILQPTPLPKDMSDNDAFVFRVTRGSKNDTYSLEKNDRLSDGVIDKYNKSIGTGKNLKRSTGMKAAFNTVKKVAKKTVWVIFMIVAVIVALVGILLFILGLTNSEMSEWIVGAVLGVIGIVFTVRTWMKRDD
jgi:hypothetical protein